MVTGDAAIWRAGANDTTRLTTQAPLQIGDKTIAPGVYNVFVDLKANQWTLVLNTQEVQPKFDPDRQGPAVGRHQLRREVRRAARAR